MIRVCLKPVLLPGCVIVALLSGGALADTAPAEALPTLDESLAAISETKAGQAVAEEDPRDVPLPGAFLLLLAALGSFVVLTGRTD